MPMLTPAIRLPHLVTALSALALSSFSVAASHTQSVLQPCSLKGINRPTECAQILVPENWSSPGGRQLKIQTAIVRASSKAPKADPILVLMGGPGEAAIDSGADYAVQFATLLQERDLLLVDQRGTGGS